MKLEWNEGSVDIRCPVCRRADDQTQLFTTHVPWQSQRFVGARCGGCGAVIFNHLIPLEVAYTGEHWDWDWYVEQAAGIEAIADTLAKVELHAGARMLDVGCGFGFGLDLGERLWAWHGTGLDPSPVARVGASQLGLDIRFGLLDEDFVTDAPFDVILMAEVVEHLPDPAAILALARRHLADDGVLLMTTPNADYVRPDTPETTLLSVLSAGHHHFLVDADGLRRLLEGAGLHTDVWAAGATVFAVASPTAAGLQRVRRDRRVSLGELTQYCDTRAADAEPGSSLQLGMRLRGVKFRAYAGDFPAAAAEIPALRNALFERHGVDLDDPDAIVALPAAPKVCVAACYFAGILARYVDHDAVRSERLLRAAARCGERQYERFSRYHDPEVPQFEMQARGELALLLLETNPNGARQVLRELDEAAARAGYATVADEYRQRVEPHLPPVPSVGARWRTEARRVGAGVRDRLRRS